MRRIPIIQSIVAGLMFVLFALSITPKLTLHDWLVNHKDQVNLRIKPGEIIVHKAGFNCNIENLVAESPFTDANCEVKVLPLNVTQPLKVCSKLPALFTTTYFFFEHRGPPMVA